MNWAKAFIRFALPPTHTNCGKRRKRTDEFCALAFERESFFNRHCANLNVPKHLWKVVSFGAQAEVVENVLLHGVQVGVFHMDTVSKSKLVKRINKGQIPKFYKHML